MLEKEKYLLPGKATFFSIIILIVVILATCTIQLKFNKSININKNNSWQDEKEEPEKEEPPLIEWLPAVESDSNELSTPRNNN